MVRWDRLWLVLGWVCLGGRLFPEETQHENRKGDQEKGRGKPRVGGPNCVVLRNTVVVPRSTDVVPRNIGVVLRNIGVALRNTGAVLRITGVVSGNTVAG